MRQYGILYSAYFPRGGGGGLGFHSERRIPMSGVPDSSFTENCYSRFFIKIKTLWNIPKDIVKQYNNDRENSPIHHSRARQLSSF